MRNEYHSFGAYILHRFNGMLFSWHHNEIIKALLSVESGELKRLIITAPPRHSKSLLVSEFFPAWALGRKPDRQIILACYGQELSNTFGSRVKNQMKAEDWNDIFPDCVVRQDSHSTKRIETTERGVFTATSIGGAVTGKGADVLIIDDPTKDRASAESPKYRQMVWDWYISTARTRLQPGGSIIIISTRWHTDDLTGRVLKADKSNKEWTEIKLPAISEDGIALWPEWFNLEYLEAIKRDIGSYEFEALYKGSPAPREGAFFKVDNLKFYLQADKPSFSEIVQSVDGATKTTTHADFSVISTWGKANNGFYLIACVRKKMEYPEFKRSLLTEYSRHNPSIMLVEDKSSGTQILQEYRDEGINLLAINPVLDKVTRAVPFSASVECGNIYFPDSSESPWVVDLISEMRDFPMGAHDDFIDTGSMAHDRLKLSGGAKEIDNPLMPASYRGMSETHIL